MTVTDMLKEWLGIVLGSVPTILACFVAIIVILAQGRRLAGAFPWALLGFVLALVVSVAAPFSQVLLRGYFISHALSYEHNGWMFGVLAVVGSVLHAVALVFLLVAAFVGKTRLAVPPPPFPRA